MTYVSDLKIETLRPFEMTRTSYQAIGSYKRGTTSFSYCRGEQRKTEIKKGRIAKGTRDKLWKYKTKKETMKVYKG
jgi:hypothetical protein